MHGAVREEQHRAMKGTQTTRKAKICLGDFWTSQSEQLLSVSPYEVSLRSELRSQNISEKM